jgi:hypothetical protein
VNSNVLSQDDRQRKLQLYRQPDPNTYPLEIIRKFTTPGKAFTAACDSCGKSDQEIYEFLGIDAGTFSKMKKGLATLQSSDWSEFCYAVNNRIYPEWSAYQIGCTLVEIKSEAERRAEAAERRAADAESKLQFLTQVMQGKVPA